ncbi:MAG: type II secretion system F family protein [Actinobacteria bacterium]|nr:type II secretion system F family protein [Actinomycetota bacterium]
MTVLVGVACLALLAVVVAPAARRPGRVTGHQPARHGERPVRRDIDRALVHLLEAVSRDLRSGLTFRTALLQQLDDQPHLLPAVREALASGAPARDALGAHRTDPGDGALVVHGLRIAAEAGGAASEILDRTIAVVRERRAWRSERHAQAAQARLSARVLTTLPVVVCAWGLATSPRVRAAYTDSSVTVVLTGIGAALNLVGWWWMRRLVAMGATA